MPTRTTETMGGRVLLAEDDAELRALLGHGLGLDGHEVVMKVDGVELEAGLSLPADIDVVISDVRMPGPSGLEILERFRKIDATTPFVLITAFGSVALHEHALALGATAVLDKPFEMDDLRDLVRRLVARNSAGTDNRSPEVVPSRARDEGVET